MATADDQGKGIHIGTVNGAVAIGNNNTVTQNSGAGPVTDPAHEELLRAVRELRQDLSRAVATPQIDALGGELAETETEIATQGAAGAGRLARLRTALADAGSVIGLLASGTAVAEAVAALVGG
ncbi:hypothetical protein OG422_19565 [Streptomyces sp. NBC_01525]|uniref:Uncharacterized protein n=1 Tax=Streptomyces benahoarensis TaxID=2595054 RepID=A0A553XSW0_9ACTN|nr:hypothetical protein [Streptomyces benahoarensis]TSB16594.1 hypothetical protein FNJ62_28150 [Streptomyces benahoarensis]TSB20050.1 hypothetical protein FNZ23_29015 [Streptomyces benahoarensis]